MNCCQILVLHAQVRTCSNKMSTETFILVSQHILQEERLQRIKVKCQLVRRVFGDPDMLRSLKLGDWQQLCSRARERILMSRVDVVQGEGLFLSSREGNVQDLRDMFKIRNMTNNPKFKATWSFEKLDPANTEHFDLINDLNMRDYENCCQLQTS